MNIEYDANLLDVVLLKCLRGAVNSVLLHVLRYVSIFDNSFSLRHNDVSWILIKSSHLMSWMKPLNYNRFLTEPNQLMHSAIRWLWED